VLEGRTAYLHYNYNERTLDDPVNLDRSISTSFHTPLHLYNFIRKEKTTLQVSSSCWDDIQHIYASMDGPVDVDRSNSTLFKPPSTLTTSYEKEKEKKNSMR
jgi:hypothetical protein